MFAKKLVSSCMLGIYMTSICIAQGVELTLPTPTDILITPTEISATLTFTTGELATSSVAYGTTESYELPPVTGASTMTHSLSFEGLTCETIYHYQITTTNELNNTAQSSDQTFVTGSCSVPIDPPAPSFEPAGDNTAFCATVSDVPAAECEALMDIYDSTGGTAWTNKTGWGVSEFVCGWFGVTCSGSNVTELNLTDQGNGNNLVGDFAISHGNLDLLTSLNISSSALTSFTGNGLVGLTTLNIQNNQLTSFSITGSSSLEYLYLSYNKLTSFDFEGLGSLLTFYLSNNLITSVTNEDVLINIAEPIFHAGQYPWTESFAHLHANCLRTILLAAPLVAWLGTYAPYQPFVLNPNGLCPAFGDETPPIIQELSPVDGVTSVGLSADFVMTFSEVVTVGTGHITLKKISDNSTVEAIDVTSGQVTGGGTNTLTINPSVTLDGSIDYYVQVGAAAIKDAADNPFAGISDNSTWNFTTLDLVSPTIQSLLPVNGAIGVSRTTNFMMTFSEAVFTGTGNIVIKKISNNSIIETIDITSGQVTGGGTNTLTINPSVTLDGSTDYYIQVAAGALQDAVNNPFAGIADNSTWNFSTVTLSTPTIVVNSLLDNGPGNCAVQCTLRDAVTTANGNANADNIIQFGNLTGTILLTNVSTLITSTKNLTIQGPGADTLTIDFNNGTNNSISQFAGNLSVSGLTFTKNNYNAFYVIAANKTFTLSDSVVTSNPTKSAVSIKVGAAIVVNISNTIFSNNTGTLQGAAIYNSSIGSNMTITNSTFSGNTSTMQGGAIYTANVITTINKSTFSGNAGPLGGAIFTNSSTRLFTVTNSIFFNNTVTNNGSMIVSGTPTNITNSTFVDTVSTSGYGIYINNDENSSVVNSIFYSNPANVSYTVCSGSFTSTNHNIDSGTSCGLAGTGDQSSTNPLLSPSWLINNGGLVKTIAILTGSPAKNAGNDGSAPVTDARGYARSGVADIGAYEYQDGGDIAKPIITTFTLPAPSSSLTVDITSLVATDAVGVTGYMLTEVNTEPALGHANWTLSAPTTYTFATEGAKTLYAWAKDAAGNISTSSSAPVTITLPPDVTKPVIDTFILPATSISLTVDITSLVATDNKGMTGYMLTEVNTEPAPGNLNWTLSAPTEYTFATEGAKTLYAWAKDAAGNISLSASGQVVITLSPTLTYAGVFTETIANDGSVTGSRYATLVNDTFSHPDTTLTEGVDYTILNKPAGLSAVMVVNGEGTIATLTFTGKATNHEAADRAFNLTITFLDGAFTDTPIASDVLGYTNSDSDVTFNDATITVNSLLDDGDGTCTEIKCTLRDAVATAQPNDTIQFGNLSGTIILTNHNPITTTQDLIIEGPGASNLTIDFDNDGNTYIDQEGGNLTISGLTLTHAPYNAIYMDFPSTSFTLNNSVVANNTDQPAIQAQNIAYVTINNSTFYNNTSGYFSAAIYSLAHGTTITNSTFYNNHGQRSGAVYVEDFVDGTATFTNTTFYNNTSVEGYSMFETDTFMTNITNSTFVDTLSTGSTATAGISIENGSHVTNSLFYSNPNNPGYKVCNTSVGSFGHNIDSANSCGLSQVTTDLISTDPLLDLGAGLQNNGGSVQTIAFLANSPARDNGTNVYTPATDARGYMRVGVADIGAYEYPDTIKPVIDPFTIPETYNFLTVPITALVATDNVRVTGYILTLVDVEPALNDPHWSASVPTTYTFASGGAKTLYAWARDAAGNISLSVSDQVTITPPVLVTCSPSAISAFTGEPITWTAVASGGESENYTFEWTGTDALTGTSNPLSKTYSTIGTKSATVVAHSGAFSSEPVMCSTMIATRSSGGGGEQTFTYGCTDPNALNYTRNVLSRSSMCRYAPGIISTKPAIPPKLDSAPNNMPLCSTRIYPTKYIRLGQKNDLEQVKLLEQYLTIFEGESLPVDGEYSSADADAVIRWQEKYRSDILTPWGESQGTGYVFITSLRKFKELFEAQCKPDGYAVSVTPLFFTRDLRLGMEGDDVRKLQEILIEKATGGAARSLALVGPTGYFGPLTKRALIEFQTSELLNPANGEMGIITIYLLTE